MTHVHMPAALEAVLAAQGLHWIMPAMAGVLAAIGLRAAAAAWRSRRAGR